jgi:hypothetical protein
MGIFLNLACIGCMPGGYFSGTIPSAAQSVPAKAIIPATKAARVANHTHLPFTNYSLREASNYPRTSHYP